jgi:DNA replication protein DnaC
MVTPIASSKSEARRAKPREERVVACTLCQDTGQVEYNPTAGITRYCDACEAGRSQAAAAARFYAEMQAEREAHIRAVNERSIARFTELHEVAVQALPGDLRAFLDTWDGRRSLLFLGPWGLGKTWRVVALARALFERAAREEWTMHLVTVPDLLDELRAGFDPEQQRGGESFHAVFGRYKATRLLILDDWGKEKVTDWAGEQFFKLINHRYEHRLPMFLTSNLKPQQLERDFPAEMDRFRQICDLVELKGESKRKAGGRS